MSRFTRASPLLTLENKMTRETLTSNPTKYNYAKAIYPAFIEDFDMYNELNIGTLVIPTIEQRFMLRMEYLF